MRRPELMDALSIHRYFSGGTGAGFSKDEFRSLFSGLERFSREIQLTAELLDYFYPHKRMGIAVDEWGVWHPEAGIENGLEQPGTLRDAVFAASLLHTLMAHAGHVRMANLAQAVNALHCLAQTHEDLLVLSPTYHVYDMMRPHMGAAALTFDLDCGTYAARPEGAAETVSTPHVTAGVSTTGKRVLATVANQTVDETVELRIDFRDAQANSVSGRVLQADSPSAVNGPDDPKAVMMRRVKLEPVDGGMVIALPPCSFHSFHFTCA
jgi:alpha-N-arabinofuranosidase